MDCLRSCYQSYMRLYPEDPDRLTLGRWRWCPEGALALPFGHAFGSCTGDPDQWGSEYPLGEVRGIVGPSKGTSSIRFTGQRYCGPREYWQQGSPLDALGTPAVDAEGVPFCCKETRAVGGLAADGVGIFGFGQPAGMWWMPEGLATVAVGDPIAIWPDSTGNGHDGIPVGAPQRPECAVGSAGLKAALMNRITGIPFADLTAWPLMTAYIVATPLGAGLQRARPRLGGLGPPGNTAILNGTPNGPNYRDTISTISAAIPIETGVTELLSYRRNGALLKLVRNGEVYLSTSISSNGEQVFNACSLTTIVSPFTGTAWLSELIIFPAYLTDDQDLAVLSYLAEKYGLSMEVNDVLTGTILAYGAATVPGGYLACTGQAVDRAVYANLFSVIGTTWGVGDGSTTFNLPDLRGRTGIGSGTGSGLSTRVLADIGGEEEHTLLINELANHTHDVEYQNRDIVDTLPTENVREVIDYAGANDVQSGPAGNDDPHNNMQPFAVVSYIIKT